MNKINLQKINNSISDKVFFLILFTYQVLFIFQGIDFADEGFHLTYYQLFFAHPESTVMNMMYWLTGIVGGTFYNLFPASGIIGMRFLGISTILLTSSIVYFFLKDHININKLRISILLIVLFVNSNDLKILYYDNLSSLMAVVSAILLYKGLVHEKKYQIVLSGAFVALSMFARLPAITLLIFVVAILYFGYLKAKKLLFSVKQCAYFVCGFIGTTLIVFISMKVLGHFEFYLENLKIVSAWGGSTEDAHNLKQLTNNFLNNYTLAVIRVILLAVFLFFLNYAWKNLAESKWRGNLPRILIQIILVLLFIYLLFSRKITYDKLLSLFAGISIIISAIILSSRKYTNESKLIVFIGLLIMIFAPLGSAGGLFGHGRNTFWIVFPFTIDFIISINKIQGGIELTNNQNKSNYLSINIDPKYADILKKYFISFSLAACIYFSYFYPYFDMSNRANMVTSIDNKLTFGILTTKERASAINELLSESSKYIDKNDIILAYDCIPMFHFLTETRPFMPNTWPWLYLPETFDDELNIASSKFGKPKAIVLQKMSTLNNDWPENKLAGYVKTSADTKRDSILMHFIKVNEYKKVWENKTFEIQLSVPEFK